MRSKISFCNVTIIKKDITRFWPLWIVEFILLLLANNVVLYFNLENIFHEEHMSTQQKMLEAQGEIVGILSGGMHVFVAAVTAIIGAVLVFGYLSRKVSAYATHSLPISRAVLFQSHYLAGFLMIVVPYILTFLGTGIINMFYGLGMSIAIFGNFLKVLIMLFFFYSMSCLLVMLSGNSEMSVLLYMVLNGLVLGFTGLLYNVMEIACYGMKSLTFEILAGAVGYFTPLYQFLRGTDSRDNFMFRVLEVESVEEMEIIKFSWSSLGRCAWYLVPAILFCVAAWFLYQKRPLENTGDTMAFSWCKTVFRIVFSLCGSMVFVMIFWVVSCEFLGKIVTYQTAYFMSVILLLIGSALSYLISDMLLTKSFMIWKKLSVLQMGIVCVVMPLLFVCCHFAYQKNSVLDMQNIKALHLQFCGTSYFYDNGEIPESLEVLQKEILEGGSKETFYDDYEDWENNISFYLEYETKNGKIESYDYKITSNRQPEMPAKIQEFFNKQEDKTERIFPKQYDVQHLNDIILDGGDEIIADDKDWSAEEKSMIYTAVIKDLNEGNMDAVDINAYNNDTSRIITFWFDEPESYKNWDYSYFVQRLCLTDKSIYTIKALKELGIEF